MVTYEYKCKDCGTKFEVTCHMEEKSDKAVCPKCGGCNVEQLLTAAFSSPRPDKF